MAIKSRSNSQLKKERRALRRLREAGLYTGKLDLRKKPTAYQRKAITKFADVLSGAASVLKPKDAAAYKGLFKTVGDKVIVPRRKGERLSVDKKSGEIIGKRKVRGRTVRSRFKRVKSGETIKRPRKSEAVQYAIPFNRGDHLEWMRHPSYDALKSFMSEYARYKGWKKYSVSEKVATADELDFEDDEDLTIILEEKLGPQYGASGGRYVPPKQRRAAKRKARTRNGQTIRRKRKSRKGSK